MLGASLPLIAGTWQTWATSADAGVENLLAPTSDFTKLEQGEDKPGGDATSRGSTDNANAFSLSSGNMGFRNELNFKIGNAIFRRLWVSAPASTDSADGLGPLFNSRGCQNCHLKDGRGHPPLSSDVPDDTGSMLFRLSVPPKTDEEKALIAAHKANSIPDPTYGGQLQDFAIQGFAAEGKAKIDYEEKGVMLAGGETVSLRAPTYEIVDLGYGPMSDDVMLSPRVAPPMIGLGLLEAVPEDQILKSADPDDENGDGISGKPNYVWSKEHDKLMLGRFGWKASVPTIAEQSANAFSGDIGISSTMLPAGSGECTAKQDACIKAPSGNSPQYQNVEVGDELFKLVTFYAQNLAVPARRNPDDPEVLKGKALFYEIGCASCHKPKFMTGEAPDQPHLSHQLIYPYTDMLLHDMGEGLADDRPDGEATGTEWRTAPLWGIGLTETVSGHTLLLHDGRARNVTEAVLWHGGEAQKARDAFANLPKEDRDRLLAFVNSL
ncbi:MAG: di-heme oxidoredictase family protein [Hyphomicrobiales bacterium]